MYSFGIGFGLGIINRYLSTKWDWVTQTNERLAAGIIGTVLYTVPVVLAIDYVVFVYMYNLEPSKFFSGNYFWIHIFTL